MKIIDMNIYDYMEILKTKAPAPGGGAVAGLTAVQGISLTLMVIDLTLGKSKYKEFEDINNEVKAESERVYKLLINSADDDYKAYTKLSEAYKLPKDTETEKATRKEVIEEAAIAAIESPLKVIELCKNAAEQTLKIVGKSNKMASSDLGVAAECFKAAAKSAWLNVKINLPCISDEEKVDYYREKGTAMLSDINTIADKIYNKVEKDI